MDEEGIDINDKLTWIFKRIHERLLLRILEVSNNEAVLKSL